MMNTNLVVNFGCWRGKFDSTIHSRLVRSGYLACHVVAYMYEGR